jgi:TonB family protein
MIRTAALLLTLPLLVACGDRAPAAGAYTPPAPIRGQEPIPYPPELYNQRIEGEVMLYVVVDTNGTVVRDSTRIATASGQTAFDSAAIMAAPSLRFTPGMRGDTAVMAPIQVPIQFTLPDSIRRAETE